MSLYHLQVSVQRLMLIVELFKIIIQLHATSRHFLNVKISTYPRMPTNVSPHKLFGLSPLFADAFALI